MRWSFLLSHHDGAGLARCFRLGPLHVCARCSGLWPTLVAGIGVLTAKPVPSSRWDLPVELALILPALWDWARSLRHPKLGTNLGRAATGALLGLGLARAAVLGRVEGYGTAGFLLPILLCSSWVVLAPRVWPDSPESLSS
ncbi:MAG TPA: DUF2085 domain-containing protein [Myxococcales bacterium]|nr:DUF2085 domain-containing protein [Myxococcales bacterium]